MLSWEICTACGGQGEVECIVCQGKGRRSGGFLFEIDLGECHECHGHGALICKKCHGTGRQERK